MCLSVVVVCLYACKLSVITNVNFKYHAKFGQHTQIAGLLPASLMSVENWRLSSEHNCTSNKHVQFTVSSS